MARRWRGPCRPSLLHSFYPLIPPYLKAKEKTVSGLTKEDLVRNKAGKIVTWKSNNAGKKAYRYIKGWNTCVTKAFRS